MGGVGWNISSTYGSGSAGLTGAITGTVYDYNGAGQAFTNTTEVDFTANAALQQYYFTYTYGNGDYYSGYGYATAGTYTASQQLTGYANETASGPGTYTIDYVYSVNYGIAGQVYVYSYYDSNGALWNTSTSAYSDFGLGSESGTVYDYNGFADSFSSYNEATLTGTSTLQQYYFHYDYGNGDSYYGYGYAAANTYTAGQAITSIANELGGAGGTYTIDSVYGSNWGTAGQVYVSSYYDSDGAGWNTTIIDGSGQFGLGSEGGGVSNYNGFADSFGSYNEADVPLGAVATLQVYTFYYDYGNGDFYYGNGFAGVGTYTAGQTWTVTNELSGGTGVGTYTIASVYGTTYGVSGEVHVNSYYDSNGDGWNTSVSGFGQSGLGTESGTVYNYSGFADSFSNYNEATVLTGSSTTLEQYYFHYDYGNGDVYYGYGYAATNIYNVADTWTVTNELSGGTGVGTYTIDSVYGSSWGTAGQVYVNSYYDGNVGGAGWNTSVSGSGQFGLGTESGTVYNYNGFADAFSSYNEANVPTNGVSALQQYYFHYDYGNGDTYYGYGYNDSTLTGITYAVGGQITGLYNTTGFSGTYTIDSVYGTSSGISGQVYVNSYYDGDGAGWNTSVSGFGQYGLGTESGTVYNYNGFADSFSSYNEADVPTNAVASLEQCYFHYTYTASGDTYYGYVFAAAGTYTAGANPVIVGVTGGTYTIDSVYGASLGTSGEVHVNSYNDVNGAGWNTTVTAWGNSGLGSESGKVTNYNGFFDSFSSNAEATVTSDKLNLPSNTIASVVTNADGTNAGALWSHSIASGGILTFGSTNAGGALVQINAANLTDALAYVASNITGAGQTVAFEYDSNNDTFNDSTVVFQQYSGGNFNQGNITAFLNNTTGITLGTSIAHPLALISSDATGAIGNAFSKSKSISGDGRYVVFESDATNLVAGDTNALTDVFIKDTQTGAITRVSTATGGTQATGGASNGADVSADGRYVQIVSDATDLVAGDTNAKSDVFIKDMVTGTTTRVSTTAAGAEATGGTLGSDTSDISADGRYVVLGSDATNLVAGDTNGVWDIFLKDTQTGAITRVNTAANGTQADIGSDSLFGKVTEDGAYVIFESNATNLLGAGNDTNGVTDIFKKTIADGAITRVSTDAAGLEANSGGITENFVNGSLANFLGGISADGRYVLFQSSATNLVAGDTNGVSDIFLKDTQTGDIMRVNTDAAGTEANGGSSVSGRAISADGRYAVFNSSASNLVEGDTNALQDVFVRDMLTGAIARVNLDAAGVQAVGGSSGGVRISADGSTISFHTNATNLVAGDTNAVQDAVSVANPFMLNPANDLGLISSDATGAIGNAFSKSKSISGDGRYVVFESDATNLVAGDTNALTDVFIKDTQTGAITRVSTATGGTQATGGASNGADVSADGRYVQIVSDATDLVAGDTNAKSDVFIKDMVTGTTTRVSTTAAGAEATGGTLGSDTSDISADGRYVVLGSDATNLVAGDTNGVWDIFLKDTQTGAITRVNTAANGTQADIGSDSLFGRMTEDGAYVVFNSNATNLLGAGSDTNGVTDIFKKNIATGAITRVSTAADGTQADSGGIDVTNGTDPQNFLGGISTDGRYVVFHSSATNLLGAGNDTNGVTDVFLKDTQTGAITRVSTDAAGAEANNNSVVSGRAISADGRYVVFHSTASDLVAGDTNGVQDIFVKDMLTGTIARVNLDVAGAQAAGGNSGGSRISADGGTISFHTNATNLVAGHVVGVQDVVSVANPFKQIQLADTTAPDINDVSFTTGANASVSFSFLENVIYNAGAANHGSILLNGIGSNIATGGNVAGNVFTVTTATTLAQTDWLLMNLGNDITDASGNLSMTAGQTAAFGGSLDNTIDMSGYGAVGLYMAGNAGNDILVGSAYADDIEGGIGADVLNGGDGADKFSFMQGDSPLVTFTEVGGAGVSAGDTFVYGGGVAERISGGFTTAGDTINLWNKNAQFMSLIAAPANGLVTNQSYFMVQGDLAGSTFTVNTATGVDTMIVYDGDSTAAITQTAVVLNGVLPNQLTTNGSSISTTLSDTTAPQFDSMSFGTGASASIMVTLSENVFFNAGGTPGSFLLNGAGAITITGSTIVGNVATLTTTATLAQTDWLLTTTSDMFKDAAGNVTPAGQVAAFGGSGNNTIDMSNAKLSLGGMFVGGQAGDDILTGSSFFATDIEGGTGADTLTGGAGSDYFIFKQGSSTAVTFAEIGGAGVSTSDTFAFAGSAADVITNFGTGDNIMLNTMGMTGIAAPGDGLVTDQSFFKVQGNYAAGTFTVDTTATGLDTMLVYDGDSTAGVSQTALILSGIAPTQLAGNNSFIAYVDTVGSTYDCTAGQAGQQSKNDDTYTNINGVAVADTLGGNDLFNLENGASFPSTLVDGGAGIDTLAFNFNYASWATGSAHTTTINSDLPLTGQFANIERIDLQNTFTDTLKLGLSDVFNISDTHSMTVMGDAGDTAQLSSAGATTTWTNTASAVVDGGVTYDVWQGHSAANDVLVMLQQGMTVQQVA